MITTLVVTLILCAISFKVGTAWGREEERQQQHLRKTLSLLDSGMEGEKQ